MKKAGKWYGTPAKGTYVVVINHGIQPNDDKLQYTVVRHSRSGIWSLTYYYFEDNDDKDSFYKPTALDRRMSIITILESGGKRK